MNWHYQINVYEQMTVRDFLHQHLLIPKHIIFQLRRTQRVLVNGQYKSMNVMVHPGDNVSITFIPTDFKQPFPEVIPTYNHTIEILFENKDLLIINKAAGVKTHPNQPGEAGSALNIAAGYLKQHHQRPYIINRLDMWTSGALMFAKNPAVVPPLTELIKTKQIQRTYLTWVTGNLPNEHGQITLPIGKDPEDKRKRRVDVKNGLAAITNYQVIRKKAHATLLKVQLATGRTHQIRVHMAAMGHPIIGDPLYNPRPGNKRLQLHSWQMRIYQPFSGQLLTVQAPRPADFM